MLIDRIQQTLESLAPELEDYRKRKVFTSKEIERIIETRRRFESKIHRGKKQLADFMQYIESEKKLERLRNRRIEQAQASFSETDTLLTKNILRIYRAALHRFEEPIVMKEFSEYCVRRKCYQEMKDVFAKECLRRPCDTDLLVFCAQKLWEVDDVERARSLFLKFAGVNGDLRLLVEFFRLECAYAARVNAINEELGIEDNEKDDIERGEVAMVIFKALAEKTRGKEIEECLEISKMVPGLRKRAEEHIQSK